MSTQVLTTVGANIRKIRKEKSISQYELSKLCGMEKANMSRLESGQSNATVLTLLKVSDALNVSVSEFFREDLAGKV
jgi:transcriptional regulator with XRE-family HTH domain